MKCLSVGIVPLLGFGVAVARLDSCLDGRDQGSPYCVLILLSTLPR